MRCVPKAPYKYVNKNEMISRTGIKKGDSYKRTFMRERNNHSLENATIEKECSGLCGSTFIFLDSSQWE